MSRIGFFADTQLGVGTVDLTDQAVVLDRIVDVFVDRQVDVVVHGGDVFEGPVVTPEHLRVFIDAMEPLIREEIPLLILRGNGRHDSAVKPVHALDVFREIDGFLVADRPEVFSFAFDGAVAVCALPWVHPGVLIARMNGSIDHDLVNQAAAGLLVKNADLLATAAGDGPKVLVAHWAISGAKLPSGLAVEQMHEPVIPWAELDALGFDLIAGAHIHEQQILSNPEIDNGAGFVIGSPQQLNYGEHGEKGCWVAEFPLLGNPEFIPIESRQFVTLDFDQEDPVAQIALSDRLGWEVAEGANVRIRARLTAEQAQKIDAGALRRSLTDAGAHSVRLDFEIERGARRRAEIDEQLSPTEAMALYCEAQEIGDPLRSLLLAMIKEWGEE